MQTTGWHALKEKGLDLCADESPSRENMHFYVACTVNGLWMLFWLFLTLYAYSFGTSHSQWAEDDEDLSAISIHVCMHMKKKANRSNIFPRVPKYKLMPFYVRKFSICSQGLMWNGNCKKVVSCIFLYVLKKKEFHENNIFRLTCSISSVLWNRLFWGYLHACVQRMQSLYKVYRWYPLKFNTWINYTTTQ